jgi:hypothetical protein
MSFIHKQQFETDDIKSLNDAIQALENQYGSIANQLLELYLQRDRLIIEQRRIDSIKFSKINGT